MEKMTTIDIVEHKLFNRFFLECVHNVWHERGEIIAKTSPKFQSSVKFKRSGFEALNDLDLLYDPVKRKAAIYACAQKRSGLSRRERDYLEHLTIEAGAKLVAYLNQTKKETPAP